MPPKVTAGPTPLGYKLVTGSIMELVPIVNAQLWDKFSIYVGTDAVGAQSTIQGDPPRLQGSLLPWHTWVDFSTESAIQVLKCLPQSPSLHKSAGWRNEGSPIV